MVMRCVDDDGVLLSVIHICVVVVSDVLLMLEGSWSGMIDVSDR